jgi:hypothetical protein
LSHNLTTLTWAEAVSAAARATSVSNRFMVIGV